MSWEVDGKSAKRLAEIADAVKDADGLILATDPDREGEAISWHVLEVLQQQEGAEGQAGRARRLQRHHQGGRARGDGQSARDRRAAGRRLSRPPRARLSRRLHALAGAVAQAAGRPLGRPRAVGGAAPRLRPRERDRALQAAGILVDRRHARARRAADASRPALVGFDGKKLGRLDIADEATARRHRGGAAKAAPSSVASVEAKPAKRNPAAALHHLDAAAGGLAQARLLRRAHHAGRAAPLRGRRHRRRDGRPHHLYANRRRADGARGDRGSARARSASEFGDRYLPEKPRFYQTKAKNAQEAHEAIRPTDFFRTPGIGAPASRCRPGAALRADLEARHRQPDGAGRDRAHDGRDRGRQRRAHGRPCAPSARSSASTASSPLYQRRPKDDDAEDEESGRLPPMAAGDTLKPSTASTPSSTSPSRRRATPKRR